MSRCQDLQTNKPLLSYEQALGFLAPQYLGLTASVGSDRVVVYRRLRIALLASGNELAMPGQPLGEGQIYNSNQFSATGILQTLGCEVIPLGIVDDTLDTTCTALIEGAAKADTSPKRVWMTAMLSSSKPTMPAAD